MRILVMLSTFSLTLGTLLAPPCKSAPDEKKAQALYRVTVVERTIKAINYHYRSGPTKIDFRGTVLLPDADGEATVKSERGRTEIDAKFDDMPPPSRFGREYLAYVLWAITPDGRPHNLGEIVPDSSDDGDIEVTTDLQAFALLVTAEPYSAVRVPSDVVVLQNEVRPDTTGRIEQVSVKYGLMPRGHYIWEKPDEKALEAAGGPKVSMSRYEALLALYEAQNAVNIASSQNAARYAPEVFGRANQLLNEAKQLDASKGDSKRIVQISRQAAQTAEDARILATRAEQDERLAVAEEARARAEADARQARADAEAARSRAEAERAARQHAEGEAARIPARTVEPAPVVVVEATPPARTEPDPAQQSSLRLRLLNDLNPIMTTRDTPRGLVVTIPDTAFRSVALSAPALSQVASIARLIAAHPGLRVAVEGHTDTGGSEAAARERAEMVRDALIARGVAASAVSASGWGDSRPVTSNATASGRDQNRRVEIVITGDPIGDLASWDRTYSVVAR